MKRSALLIVASVCLATNGLMTAAKSQPDESPSIQMDFGPDQSDSYNTCRPRLFAQGFRDRSYDRLMGWAQHIDDQIRENFHERNIDPTKAWYLQRRLDHVNFALIRRHYECGSLDRPFVESVRQRLGSVASQLDD